MWPALIHDDMPSRMRYLENKTKREQIIIHSFFLNFFNNRSFLSRVPQNIFGSLFLCTQHGVNYIMIARTISNQIAQAIDIYFI